MLSKSAETPDSRGAIRYTGKILMGVSKDLFEVIKSLSVGENLALRRQLAPKRAVLYDVFRDLETHDHDVIKSHFPNDSAQNLSSSKRQLLDLILKVLWQLTPDDGIRELAQHLGEVQVLMRKALFEVALSRLETVIPDALGLEAMQELLSALRLKRQILEIISAEAIDPLQDADLQNLAETGLGERGHYEGLYSQSIRIRTLPLVAQEGAISQLQGQLDLEQAEPRLVRNQLKLLRTRYVVYRLRGNHELCKVVSSAFLERLDAHPLLMGDPALRDDYFINFQYVITYDTEVGNFVEAEKGLKRFEWMAKKWSGGIQNDPILYGRHTQSALWLRLARKDLEGAKKLAYQVMQEVMKTGQRLTLRHRTDWLRMTMLVLFVMRDYRSVRKLAMELKLAIPTPTFGNDFITAIGMFHLAAVWEEEPEYLGTAVAKVREWLGSSNCLGEYEARMLNFFEACSITDGAQHATLMLSQLQTELQVLFQNELLWQYRDSFPVMQWIRSKMDGTDLRNLIFS
jgi:hypothetical protein